MTEKKVYDFIIVSKVGPAYIPNSRFLSSCYVWECQECFCLTSSPEKHARKVHDIDSPNIE